MSPRFRYARDPLCLGACGTYLLIRCLLKRLWPAPFLHGQATDLLLIPCALPWILWLQRRCGLRAHDRFPGPAEIGLHLLVWSVVCEGIAPRLFPRAVGDPWDVLAYTIGALVSGWIWSRQENRRQQPALLPSP